MKLPEMVEMVGLLLIFGPGNNCSERGGVRNENGNELILCEKIERQKLKMVPRSSTFFLSSHFFALYPTMLSPFINADWQ